MELNEDSDYTSEDVSMGYLPDDVLIEIFNYLNFEEICKCSQVCHRWYHLSHYGSCRKKIRISKELSYNQLLSLAFFHFRKPLQELELAGNYKNSSILSIQKSTMFRLKEKCPELRKLNLTYCALHATLLDMPTSLRYLSVRLCEINPYDFFTSQPQNYVPYLKCLDVGRVNNFLTSEDLHIFKNLNSLRCLNLEGCFRINNGGIESIKEVIQHLEVLNVESTDISDEGVEIILAHGPMLKELFVGYNNLTDNAFSDVKLKAVPKLKTLCMRNTHVTDQSIKKFSKAGINVIYDQDQLGNFLKVLVKIVSGHPTNCNHHLSHSCSC